MLLLALLCPAFAAETRVLVSAIQPESLDDRALATLIENYLAEEISADTTLDVIRIEDTRDFEDYSARIYVQGCPPGDILGCTAIIAGRGDADFAVTGSVTSEDDVAEVEIEILNMRESRVVVSFRSELASGDNKAFAQGVARVLAAAISGEVGAENDIRDDDDQEEAPKLDNDAVARQIAQLSKDLGEVTVALSRPNRAIPKTTYTVEDLVKATATDAAKPWERLSMTAPDYLRYKNSGMALMDWRERSLGRKGQLMITPLVGFANGAMRGSFYGSYATDDTTAVVDSWSAESQQSGSGAWVSGVISYGVLPALDVGVAVGMQTGGFTLDVDDEVVGQPAEPSESLSFQAQRLTLGARVGLGFLPTRNVRPRAGVGLDWMQGYSVSQFQQMPEWITVFAPQSLLVGQVYIGGEARISKNVDFVAQVPLTLLLAGATPVTSRTGTQDVVTPDVPDGPPFIGVGATVGVQVRLFGSKPPGVAIDEMDEI